jgi:nicotinate-nucleotide pyrophosphorylase (carboxylating)
VLIKENHITAAGGLGAAVRSAREAQPELEIEVECRTLEEVSAALDVAADRLLLDNMDPATIARAVELRDGSASAHGPVATLEASGGVSLETVGAIAAAGPDFISVGALTHSAPALDLSLMLD